MRKSLSLFVAAALISLIPFAAAEAGTGTFGSYIGVDSGSGNIWYGATQPGATLWGFDGADLGDFTVGDSLILSGAELLTWKNGGGDVTGASVHFALYADGATPGGFTSTTISHSANNPFNDAAGNTFTNGGDQKWASIDSTPDMLSGVVAGNYNLAMYFTASTNEGVRHDNNSGNNFVASFSVASASGGGGGAVPEPAACLLLIAGIIPLALLRRRK
jgi:hypothetical protein